MDEKMKQLLLDEIMSADNADTVAYMDDMVAFHAQAGKQLGKVEDCKSLKDTASAIAKARSSSLTDFLKRKKLVKETIEEIES